MNIRTIQIQPRAVFNNVLHFTSKLFPYTCTFAENNAPVKSGLYQQWGSPSCMVAILRCQSNDVMSMSAMSMQINLARC